MEILKLGVERFRERRVVREVLKHFCEIMLVLSDQVYRFEKYDR